MKTLEEILNWLSISPLNMIEIWNVATEKAIVKRLTAAQMGDAETYFKDLESRGIHKIALQRSRKQGSSQVRVGIMHKFEIGKNPTNQLVDGGNKAQAPATQPSIPTPPPVPSYVGSSGLGVPGMGFADVMNMNTKASKYDEKKNEAERLQTKLDAAELENKRLWQENLEFKIGLDSKPGTVDKLLEALSNNPELITTAVQALAKQKAVPALNAPEGEGLSQIKTALIQVISRDDVSDDVALGAYHLISQSAQGNQSFIAAFREILKDHQLLNNQQHENSNGASQQSN